jgi:hypothetical protein
VLFSFGDLRLLELRLRFGDFDFGDLRLLELRLRLGDLDLRFGAPPNNEERKFSLYDNNIYISVIQ